MTHQHNVQEEIEIPVEIDGPNWFICFSDENAESYSLVVIGELQTAYDKNGATIKELDEDGHDIFVRYGYKWNVEGEASQEYFAMSEDDAYCACDSLLNERRFYDLADEYERSIDG